MKCNARRRKNFIQRLKVGQVWKYKHDDKAEVIHTHFSNVMATPSHWVLDFDWDGIQLQSCELHNIGTTVYFLSFFSSEMSSNSTSSAGEVDTTGEMIINDGKFGR